jgi:hypothetical protein
MEWHGYLCELSIRFLSGQAYFEVLTFAQRDLNHKTAVRVNGHQLKTPVLHEPEMRVLPAQPQCSDKKYLEECHLLGCGTVWVYYKLTFLGGTYCFHLLDRRNNASEEKC